MTARSVATIRFYAELNTYLRPWSRGTSIRRCFEPGETVKDMIETLGVPLAEVALIVVNGEPVGLSHGVRPSDRISVFPAFTSLDTAPLEWGPSGSRDGA